MSIAAAPSAQPAARPAAVAPISVRLWLAGLILLVFAMVLVGGATRLTESGLAITEWNLVAGALPPLGGTAWRQAFDLYRQSPQYALLNEGMSLADFKTIYWWEWAHRELGRFIGLYYFAGFLWFWWRRNLSAGALAALASMGILLGAQGFVGWIMVASGLEPGMSAVAPVRLTLHLTLASLFFACAVAMLVRLGGAPRERVSSRRKCAAGALVALAFAQIAFGGLVAGSDAGLTYNTWPLMDGRFVPRGLLLLDPPLRNVVDNVAAVQFNHRIGAYVLALAVLGYAAAGWGAGGLLRGRSILLAALVVAQVAIGVATLVHVVPIGLALMHQGLAMVLLFALVWNASVLRTAPSRLSSRFAAQRQDREP